MTKPVIGFIGLGLMGSNMVENLQNRGFEPIVMDLNKDAVAAVVARGATEASSAKELAAASDIVMLCLTTSKVVEMLVYAEDGIRDESLRLVGSEMCIRDSLWAATWSRTYKIKALSPS